MKKADRAVSRDELLAHVAEQYYREDMTQSEIAGGIGVTRSAVSRMLTEARRKGLVEIIIHHPISYDQHLEGVFRETFGLERVAILDLSVQPGDEQLKQRLARAAARILRDLIQPGFKVGISWGTSIQAAIEVFRQHQVADTEVIQLVGVLGSSRHSYSAQTLVDQMAQKIGGRGTYLYAPFIVENRETAASLMEDPTLKEIMTSGRKCQLALLGVGSTKPDFCSLFTGKHITRQELETMQAAGAVGDVSALYFNREGEMVDLGFHQRRIGISREGLLEIPIRLGVAGGMEKADAILGALRGAFINALVTDRLTARRILDLAGNEPGPGG